MMESSHHPVQRRAALALAGLAVLAVGLGSAFADEGGDGQTRAGRVEANAATASTPPALTLETFLDRLMMAESDGRDELRNPRSTAVGPFNLSRERSSKSSNGISPKRRGRSRPWQC